MATLRAKATIGGFMKCIICALANVAGSLLLLMATTAFAVLPDSGFYYVAAESGKAFNIEIQNSQLVIMGYLYDQSGDQFWVYSGGPMSSDSTYSGPAYKTTNGQPLGGAYHPPTNVPFGTATVTFTTTMTANININGYTFAVERFPFGIDLTPIMRNSGPGELPTSVAQPLLGEWAFVEGGGGSWFGERVVFTRVAATGEGAFFAVGYKSGDPARHALGNYSSNQWHILMDSSDSYYNFKTFVFDGFNLVEGSDYTYLKGSSPGAGFPMIGYRIKSAEAAAGLNAPGVSKRMPRSDPSQSDAKDAAKASVQPSKQVDLADIDVRALESALRAMQQQAN
jgi:hypothetical protein